MEFIDNTKPERTYFNELKVGDIFEVGGFHYLKLNEIEFKTTELAEATRLARRICSVCSKIEHQLGTWGYIHTINALNVSKGYNNAFLYWYFKPNYQVIKKTGTLTIER